MIRESSFNNLYCEPTGLTIFGYTACDTPFSCGYLFDIEAITNMSVYTLATYLFDT